MKATDLLEGQHRDLETLLEKLRTAGQGEDRNLRQELAANLVAHTVIEEEHFYPAVRELLSAEILEAIEEHGLADVELARLLASGPGDETSDAKLAVLSELLIRHIRREETDVFKAADRELGEETQDQLGNRMALRFRQVVETGYSRLLQQALEEELPRTASRAPAARTAKKATRRTAAGKKKAAPKARAVPRRAPAKRTAKRTGAKPVTAKPAATKRAATKRAATKRPLTGKRSSATTPRKSPKQAQPARGSSGTSRTRA